MLDTESGLKGKSSENSQSQQLVQYASDEEKKACSYKYLWISEKFYLEGIIQFVRLAKTSQQRSLNDLESPINCVFNDIIRLDFTKFKQTLQEYEVNMKEKQILENQKKEEKKNELEARPSTTDVTAPAAATSKTAPANALNAAAAPAQPAEPEDPQ